MRKIGDVISEVNPMFKKFGVVHAKLFMHWSDIVGKDLYSGTIPHKVVNDRNGGILYLQINNGSLALQVQHLVPMIIDKITMFCGYRAISRIKVFQVG